MSARGARTMPAVEPDRFGYTQVANGSRDDGGRTPAKVRGAMWASIMVLFVSGMHAVPAVFFLENLVSHRKRPSWSLCLDFPRLSEAVIAIPMVLSLVSIYFTYVDQGTAASRLFRSLWNNDYMKRFQRGGFVPRLLAVVMVVKLVSDNLVVRTKEMGGEAFLTSSDPHLACRTRSEFLDYVNFGNGKIRSKLRDDLNQWLPPACGGNHPCGSEEHPGYNRCRRYCDKQYTQKVQEMLCVLPAIQRSLLLEHAVSKRRPRGSSFVTILRKLPYFIELFALDEFKTSFLHTLDFTLFKTGTAHAQRNRGSRKSSDALFLKDHDNTIFNKSYFQGYWSKNKKYLRNHDVYEAAAAFQILRECLPNFEADFTHTGPDDLNCTFLEITTVLDKDHLTKSLKDAGLQIVKVQFGGLDMTSAVKRIKQNGGGKSDSPSKADIFSVVLKGKDTRLHKSLKKVGKLVNETALDEHTKASMDSKSETERQLRREKRKSEASDITETEAREDTGKPYHDTVIFDSTSSWGRSGKECHGNSFLNCLYGRVSCDKNAKIDVALLELWYDLSNVFSSLNLTLDEKSFRKCSYTCGEMLLPGMKMGNLIDELPKVAAGAVIVEQASRVLLPKLFEILNWRRTPFFVDARTTPNELLRVAENMALPTISKERSVIRIILLFMSVFSFPRFVTFASIEVGTELSWFTGITAKCLILSLTVVTMQLLGIRRFVPFPRLMWNEGEATLWTSYRKSTGLDTSDLDKTDKTTMAPGRCCDFLQNDSLGFCCGFLQDDEEVQLKKVEPDRKLEEITVTLFDWIQLDPAIQFEMLMYKARALSTENIMFFDKQNLTKELGKDRKESGEEIGKTSGAEETRKRVLGRKSLYETLEEKRSELNAAKKERKSVTLALGVLPDEHKHPFPFCWCCEETDGKEEYEFVTVLRSTRMTVKATDPDAPGKLIAWDVKIPRTHIGILLGFGESPGKCKVAWHPRLEEQQVEIAYGQGTNKVDLSTLEEPLIGEVMIQSVVSASPKWAAVVNKFEELRKQEGYPNSNREKEKVENADWQTRCTDFWRHEVQFDLVHLPWISSVCLRIVWPSVAMFLPLWWNACLQPKRDERGVLKMEWIEECTIMHFQVEPWLLPGKVLEAAQKFVWAALQTQDSGVICNMFIFACLLLFVPWYVGAWITDKLWRLFLKCREKK